MQLAGGVGAAWFMCDRVTGKSGSASLGWLTFSAYRASSLRVIGLSTTTACPVRVSAAEPDVGRARRAGNAMCDLHHAVTGENACEPGDSRALTPNSARARSRRSYTVRPHSVPAIMTIPEPQALHARMVWPGDCACRISSDAGEGGPKQFADHASAAHRPYGARRWRRRLPGPQGPP